MGVNNAKRLLASLYLCACVVGMLLVATAADEGAKDTVIEGEEGGREGAEEEIEVDEEKLTYAKGSLCTYCEYCKFCALCDEQCPCETGPRKPACKMCKYCTYCPMCKVVCGTVCQPGGILDKVSASVVNALSIGKVDTDDVDKDIQSVKYWINKKKDEL